MKRKIILFAISLTLLLSTWLCLQKSNPAQMDNVVPNGSLESGTVGLVPDNWVMMTDNWNELGVENATYINEIQQTDQKYFEGERSLRMHSRIVDTDGLKQAREASTKAETEDWITAPLATHVRIHIRDIKSTHSNLGWGWANNIYLRINNVSVARTYCAGSYYGWIFTHGETCNFNQYNYTATGADGESWFVYEYSIPETVDKTHMKIQILCDASDWTFYDTSYFSDLEFVVDKVELLSPNPDLNGDDRVDMKDMGIVSAAYGSRPGDEGWNPLCDLMSDKIVDWFDVCMVTRMFGWSAENPISPNPVEWKLNITIDHLVRGIESHTVTILSDYVVFSNYSFNHLTAELTFDVTSSIDGFCNITIPRGLLNGAFRVELDDVAVPSILTWNGTHTCIYFTSDQLSHRVKIVGLTPGDVTAVPGETQPIVDIFDVVFVSTHFEDPLRYIDVYLGPHFY